MAGSELTLWLKSRLDGKSFRNTGKDAVNRYQQMGQQAGNAFAQGLGNAAPRVRRAHNAMGDAAADYTRKVQEARRAQQDHNEAIERAKILNRALEAQYDRNAAVAGEVAKVEQEVEKARTAVSKATEIVEDREEHLRDLRAAHHKTAETLRQKELDLKQIRLDQGSKAAIEFEKTIMDLRRRNAAETAYITSQDDELKEMRVELEEVTDKLKDTQSELNEVNKEYKASVKDLDDTEKDLLDTRSRANKLSDDIIRRNEAVSKSYRNAEESVRSFHEAQRADHDRKSRAAGGGKSQFGKFAGIAGNIVTSIPFVPSGPAGVPAAIGITSTLIQVAGVAAAASQSLWLLPAAITAVGAGFGTLALATSGFGEALENMGDPEKFAEALQNLSPSAQQAALSIKNLVDGPLKELKTATQEALFAGVGEELHKLTAQWGPEIQGLTTSIAGSFNQMFMGFSEQLSKPETRTAIESLFTSLGSAFQALVPVMPELTRAFSTIASVGASFLPGIAEGAANAATAFADFIAKAQASGDLKRWLGEGLDSLGQLGSGIASLARSFASLAPIGQKILPHILRILQEIEPMMPAIGFAAMLLGPPFGLWDTAIQQVSNSFKILKDVFGTVYDAIESGLTKLIDTLDRMLDPVRDALEVVNKIAGTNFQIGRFGSDDQQGGRRVNKGDGGIGDRTGSGLAPGGRGSGTIPKDQAPNSPWFPGQNPKDQVPPYGGPFPVPLPEPKDADGSKITESERRERIGANLPIESFLPDLGVPMPAGMVPPGMPGTPGAASSAIGDGSGRPPTLGPGANGLPPIQYGTNGDPYAKPGYGYNDVDQRDVLRERNNLLDDQYDLADARRNLAILERDNLATDQELMDAREKVRRAEGDFQESQLDFQDALQGKWKKLGKDQQSTSNELSAGLDADLGISRGLAGLADNLVRFVGNLATAPLQQALKNIIDANPNEGSGLIGIAAARGAFGEQFTPQGIAAQQAADGNGSSSMMSASSAMSANGTLSAYNPSIGMPSNLNDTGSVASGPQSRNAAALIQQLFPGVRGQIGGSRDNNTAPGTHDAGLSIDIPIGPDQMELGDQINAWLQQNAQQLGLKYSIWRNQGVQTDGGTFTAGGHMDHIDAHFNGQGGVGQPTMPMAGAPGMPSFGAGPAGLPLPLPVYIVGGGGVGAGGMPGAVGARSTGGAPTMGFGAMPAGLGTQVNPGQGAEGWRQTVASVISQYGPQMGINPSQYKVWEDAIVKQIDTESKGDPNAQNPNDSNGQGGTQSVSGLLQYLPQTYAATGGKLTGRPFMDPVGQIAGALFAQRNPDGSPILGTGGGWAPNTNTPIGAPGAGGMAPGMGMPQGYPMPFKQGPGGLPGLPASGPGGVGQSAGYSPIQQPQAPQGWQPGGGGGGGGILDSAMGAASMGLDMMAPGAGAAAQIAMQMIKRTIQYGGEMAGHAVQGVQDFWSVSDPDGGTGASIQDSWLGRLAGSVAGAGVSLPATAGKQDKQPNAQGAADGAVQGAAGPPGPGGPTVQIDKFVQAPNRNSQQVLKDMALQGYSSGFR